jgi:hypothetical protein
LVKTIHLDWYRPIDVRGGYNGQNSHNGDVKFGRIRNERAALRAMMPRRARKTGESSTKGCKNSGLQDEQSSLRQRKEPTLRQPQRGARVPGAETKPDGLVAGGAEMPEERSEVPERRRAESRRQPSAGSPPELPAPARREYHS